MTAPVGLKIVLAMLLWAACFPLITVGLPFAPHLTFAALRAVIAGATLIILASVMGRPSPPAELRIWAALIVVALGATSLGFVGMFHAAEFVSPGLATVIANTQPLMAAFLAALWLGERVSAAAALGLGTGFAGILLIAAPQLLDGSDQNYAVGVGFILLAALGVTLSNVAIKTIAGEFDVLMAMGFQLLIGALPLAIGAAISEDPFSVAWNPTFVTSLLLLSLLGSALVSWLWFSALATVELTRANSFSFLVPVFGLSLGILFFDEKLSGIQIAGISLILFGIMLVNRARPKDEERARSS